MYDLSFHLIYVFNSVTEAALKFIERFLRKLFQIVISVLKRPQSLLVLEDYVYHIPGLTY